MCCVGVAATRVLRRGRGAVRRRHAGPGATPATRERAAAMAGYWSTTSNIYTVFCPCAREKMTGRAAGCEMRPKPNPKHSNRDRRLRSYSSIKMSRPVNICTATCTMPLTGLTTRPFHSAQVGSRVGGGCEAVGLRTVFSGHACRN
jgi:hypothetical protein